MIDLWHFLITAPAGPVYHTLPLIIRVPLGFWQWGPA